MKITVLADSKSLESGRYHFRPELAPAAMSSSCKWRQKCISINDPSTSHLLRIPSPSQPPRISLYNKAQLHALPNPPNPHPHIHPHKHYNHHTLSPPQPNINIPPPTPTSTHQQSHPPPVHAQHTLPRLPVQQRFGIEKGHDGLPDQEERGGMAGRAVAGAVSRYQGKGHRGAVYGGV